MCCEPHAADYNVTVIRWRSIVYGSNTRIQLTLVQRSLACIREVVHGFELHMRGGDPSIESVLDAHSDLLPELSVELRKAQLVHLCLGRVRSIDRFGPPRRVRPSP